MHPNEAVIRRHLGALAAGDVEAAPRDYAEDGTIHYPGRNRLSGEHRGQKAVRDFLALAMQLTEGTFRPAVHDVLANDEHAVLLVHCEASRGGKSYEWLAVDVFHVANDRITGHWVLEGEQHLVDELFA
jgi:ketosteroid isomerase-like protein